MISTKQTLFQALIHTGNTLKKNTMTDFYSPPQPLLCVISKFTRAKKGLSSYYTRNNIQKLQSGFSKLSPQGIKINAQLGKNPAKQGKNRYFIQMSGLFRLCKRLRKHFAHFSASVSLGYAPEIHRKHPVFCINKVVW